MEAVSIGSPQQAKLQHAIGIYWPIHPCGLCRTRPATGLFLCEYSDNIQGRLLCAACGFNNGAARVTLVCTISPKDDLWAQGKWALTIYKPHSVALVAA